MIFASLEQHHFIDDPFWNKAVLFILAAISMTAIEYIAGVMCLRIAKVRLWDYSTEWGNIQGIICPQYSFYWMLLSALYYFLVHPHILAALEWLSQNLAFSFGIGFFYGILVIDFSYSAQLVAKIRRYADEQQIVVRLEGLREHVRNGLETRKPRFLLSLKTDRPFNEILEEYAARLNTLRKK